MYIKKFVKVYLLVLCNVVVLFGQQFQERAILYDGETRIYKLYIPSSYDGSEPYSLIFNFHGGSADIDSQIAIADMRSIADTAKLLLVYPQALADPNDGGSTNWLHKEPTNVDDVFFIEDLIDTIASQYLLNENRIYACGYSLGGEFTYELACRLNHKIAAVAAVARTMGIAAYDNCFPTHPTGILTILGTNDNISPYEGLIWGGIQYYLSADDMHDYWASYNECNIIQNITQLPNINSNDGSTVEKHSWSNETGCIFVEHLKVIAGGHDWPGSFGNMDISATEEIWKFVSQFNLNGSIDCNITSVNENTNKRSVFIYPNPASNILNILSQKNEIINYAIHSIDGKKLFSGYLKQGVNAIDVSFLAPSVYFIRFGNHIIKCVISR